MMFTWKRHCDCFRLIHECWVASFTDINWAEQWFLDLEWNFQSREDAYKIVVNTNQILRKHWDSIEHRNKLFSEDLY